MINIFLELNETENLGRNLEALKKGSTCNYNIRN